MGRGFALTVSQVVLGALFAGCQAESLPPYPEVLVELDTDAPVPLAVSRLRIDLFDARGAWFDSRDVNLDSPSDWPSSFGLYSSGAPERTATVRLRAYPEGSLRDYCAGCRRSAPEDLRYDPRPSPRSISELCKAAPTLAWGSSLTQRRGAHPLSDGGSRLATCGSVAVRVTVGTAGLHHFEASAPRANSGSNLPKAPALSLFARRRCEDESSELALAPAITQGVDSTVARLDLELEPGEYTLIASGDVALEPTDVTIRSASKLEPADTSGAGALDPETADESTLNLVMTDPSTTPTTEPLPAATIDRLVLLSTIPSVKRAAPLLLASDCFGIPAKLMVADGLLQASRSSTCINAARPWLPLSSAELETNAPVAQGSSVGSWGPRVLCANPSPPGAICVGGGAFLLGGPDFAGFGVSSSMPERVVKLSAFSLDRYEVTVGRFCEAVASGFKAPDSARPIPAGRADCVEVVSSGQGESIAVFEVSWFAARAFCRFAGGDLPSEAEWEFAASLAGRATKTLFPWGDERPDCDRAVFGRGDTALSGGIECRFGGPGGALPVDAAEHPGGDLTPQGIVGLGGGVSEWVLDAAHSFAGPCWTNTFLTDPVCWEEEAVLRSQRGHGWTDSAGALRATARRRRPPQERDVAVGFRCAYEDEAR